MTQKTFLILINNATSMAIYHMGLGDFLEKKGHQVIYAFSDYLPIYTEKLNLSGKRYYVFTDYFKENEDTTTFPSKYNGINLWKTLFSDFDRNVTHHKQTHYRNIYSEKLLANLVNFFDTIISENQIDLCLYESISNCFAYVCYEVGVLNSVTYCGYAGSRLSNCFELYTEEFGMIERFKNTFENINFTDISPELLTEIHEYLAKYKKGIPSYHPPLIPEMAKYSFIKRYFNSNKYKLIRGILVVYLKKRDSIKYSFQTGNPLSMIFKAFKYQITRRIRIHKGSKYFDQIKDIEDYVLFPLHMKPEASTSVLAKHFCDDLSVIKNIAFNLPFGWKLYVKEHFVNCGNMPVSFYKELKEIPNLRLISSSENTYNLVSNCKALITLTSTMGFEALLMNKKVIVLGEVFYQCHPNSIKIHDFNNLFSILNKLDKVTPDDELSAKFLAAYYKNTYSGSIYYTSSGSVDVKRFAISYYNAIIKYNETQENIS